MKLGLNSVDLSRGSQAVNSRCTIERIQYKKQQVVWNCWSSYLHRVGAVGVLTPWDPLDRSTELRPNFTWVSLLWSERSSATMRMVGEKMCPTCPTVVRRFRPYLTSYSPGIFHECGKLLPQEPYWLTEQSVCWKMIYSPKTIDSDDR